MGRLLDVRDGHDMTVFLFFCISIPMHIVLVLQILLLLLLLLSTTTVCINLTVYYVSLINYY